MNIEHLRRALKTEWLTYYRTNRDWIIKLGVWVNCQGQRRPSSSFILGALSSLEPQLTQLLPLVVDLNCNPDRIVTALGLNFNPEDELAALEELESPPTRPRPIVQSSSAPVATQSAPKLLPSSSAPVSSVQSHLVQSHSVQTRSMPIAASSPAAPYLEPEPSGNPFGQPSLFELAQPIPAPSDSSQSNSSQSNSGQSDPAKSVDQPAPAKSGQTKSGQSGASQSKSGQSRSEPTEANPVQATPPKPLRRTPAARRPLDTAQLNARELPDRDTSRRSRRS